MAPGEAAGDGEDHRRRPLHFVQLLAVLPPAIEPVVQPEQAVVFLNRSGILSLEPLYKQLEPLYKQRAALEVYGTVSGAVSSVASPVIYVRAHAARSAGWRIGCAASWTC